MKNLKATLASTLALTLVLFSGVSFAEPEAPNGSDGQLSGIQGAVEVLCADKQSVLRYLSFHGMTDNIQKRDIRTKQIPNSIMYTFTNSEGISHIWLEDTTNGLCVYSVYYLLKKDYE